MELIIKKINGKFNDYSEVTAPYGYCFYDKDEQDRNYMERIFTPVTDVEKLREQFVLVEGNADKLNEELHNEETNNNPID